MTIKTTVDINAVRRVLAFLDNIDSIPFDEITWMDGDEIIVVPPKAAADWKFVGLCNHSFVEHEGWKFDQGFVEMEDKPSKPVELPSRYSIRCPLPHSYIADDTLHYDSDGTPREVNIITAADVEEISGLARDASEMFVAQLPFLTQPCTKGMSQAVVKSLRENLDRSCKENLYTPHPQAATTDGVGEKPDAKVAADFLTSHFMETGQFYYKDKQ